jgi:hypothetical protein
MHNPSKTRLHYIDLHPEPLERPEREPSAMSLLLGALVVCAALWVLALVLFTL